MSDYIDDTSMAYLRGFHARDELIDSLRAEVEEWKEAARMWREDKSEDEARLERELERLRGRVQNPVCSRCGNRHDPYIDHWNPYYHEDLERAPHE